MLSALQGEGRENKVTNLMLDKRLFNTMALAATCMTSYLYPHSSISCGKTLMNSLQAYVGYNSVILLNTAPLLWSGRLVML